jgi:hypothetical protein
MNHYLVPDSSEELFALAELIENSLAENPPSLQAPPNLGAVIRNSLASARYTEDAFRAIFAASKVSEVAPGLLSQAATARDQALRHLRRRVSRHLDLLCDYMGDESLFDVLNT